MVDPEPILGTPGMRREYVMDGIPVVHTYEQFSIANPTASMFFGWGEETLMAMGKRT